MFFLYFCLSCFLGGGIDGRIDEGRTVEAISGVQVNKTDFFIVWLCHEDGRSRPCA